MRIFTISILVSLVILGGCAPASKSATYILPPTPGGRLCTHQCLEAQDYCHQTCDIKQRECVMKVQTQAMSDYDNYTRAQFFSHEPIELTPSDFERQTPCTNNRSECADMCDNHYQTCYQECGGQVNLTTSCQFLCF